MSITRRQFHRVVAGTAAAGALAGCEAPLSVGVDQSGSRPRRDQRATWMVSEPPPAFADAPDAVPMR